MCLYVLISCFVVMLSFLILMNAGINMKFNKINMISFVFYIYFILMSYIGQILVLENIVFVDAFPLLIKNNYYECLYVWISTSYAMIMFSSTIYLINKLIFKRKLINNKLKKSIIVLDDHANSCLYLVLSLLSIVVIVNIVIRLKYVGVLNLFLGGYDSAIRSYFTYNFTYNQYVVNIIGFILSQILTYIWYIKWSIFKNKYYLFMFIIMLIFSLIILSMRLAKAPILIYLFSFVLLKVKINGEIKIHKFFDIAHLLLHRVQFFPRLFSMDLIVE